MKRVRFESLTKFLCVALGAGLALVMISAPARPQPVAPSQTGGSAGQGQDSVSSAKPRGASCSYYVKGETPAQVKAICLKEIAALNRHRAKLLLDKNNQ
jgi:hypothetical protein